MAIYSIDGKLILISEIDFVLEKDIQNICENNIRELFGLEIVKSEFAIKNFRIDTLAFDSKSKSFVIIEYKKDKNFSIIDQVTHILHYYSITRLTLSLNITSKARYR